MKVLIVDTMGVALDFAIQCQNAGHDVKINFKKRKFGDKEEVPKCGTGLVKTVLDWKKEVDWADLIFLTDNVQDIDFIDSLIKKGYPIFGPTKEGARTEIDRQFGQDTLKSAGIKILDGVKLKSKEEAEAFLIKNPDRYVSKPDGDAPKSLTYVSKSVDDMLFMLSYWKQMGTLVKSFQFQTFTAGIEMAVGGWYSPKAGFSKYFFENWEFKNLMNDDLGVACYDKETEVLTKAGWKNWSVVTANDKLMTLNPVTNDMFYEKPKKMFKLKHQGKMIGWKDGTVDVLVTPTHNMYVNQAKQYEFISAENLAKSSQSATVKLAGGVWKSDNKVEVPKIFEGMNLKSIASLINYFLLGGCVENSHVVFKWLSKQSYDRLLSFAKDCGYGLEIGKNPGNFSSYSIKVLNSDFYTYCKDLKAIPQWIKDLSVDILSKVISNLFDESVVHEQSTQKLMSVYTDKTHLQSDYSELFLKAGFSAEPISTLFNISKDLEHVLPDHYEIDYDDYVYCAEVSSHILYVRRNGKALWCGNTGEQGTVGRYTKESKLADIVLKPLEKFLKSVNYVGYVDINCIIAKDGTPYPLEFTSRPGWPCFILQTSAHLGDPVQWMKDLIDGKDTLQVSTDPVVCVVVSQPDYPYSRLTQKNLTGMPIYGITKENQNDVRLCDVMMGKVPKLENGKIKQVDNLVTCGDYIAVCTGSGKTISEAQLKAYEVVRSINIPNSVMYRTDIGARLIKQLPILKTLGYCEDLKSGGGYDFSSFHESKSSESLADKLLSVFEETKKSE